MSVCLSVTWRIRDSLNRILWNCVQSNSPNKVLTHPKLPLNSDSNNGRFFNMKTYARLCVLLGRNSLNFYRKEKCLKQKVSEKKRTHILCSTHHSRKSYVSVRFVNEELHDLYSSPSIIRMNKSRKMRWAGHVARMGEKRNAYRILPGKPEGKRPLGRRRRRWVYNIQMDLR
jgi:hypothetical protein